MKLNWLSVFWLTLTIVFWSLSFFFTYQIGYGNGEEDGFEKGKKYVRDILIQETDSLIQKQKMFPDNPRYQSLIDEWYSNGTLPVKE